MKSLVRQLSQKKISLFIVLIVFDILIVCLHLLFGNKNTFFHLDFENNLPTYYQAGKLIVFGSFLLILGFTRFVKRNVKSFILPLSFFLVVVGFDELLQIHENIYRIFEFFEWLHPSKIVDASMKLGYKSSLWILYYLPFIVLFVFWSGYWLRYFQTLMKKNAVLLLSSSACISVVLLCEILSSTGTYTETTYFGLVTFEEMAELLFASTLVFLGATVSSQNIKT